MMMKKYFAILIALLCLCTCFIPCNMIFADEPAVTIDYATPIEVGNKFTVTLRFTSATANIAKVDGWLTYDANIIEVVQQAEGISGGSGQLRILENAIPAATNLTVTLTFEAKAAGATILAVSCDVLDEIGNSLGTAAASTPLKTNDSTTLLSGNANLASLTIPAGTLTPAFSPDITEYTVEVDNNVTTFLLSAKAEEPDKVQGVSITGSQYLSVGTNQRAVTVIAQDGTQKKYVITIYRAAPPQTPTPEKTEAPVTTPPATTASATPTPTPTPTQETPIVTEQGTATPQETPVATTPAPSTVTPTSTSDTGMTGNNLKNTVLLVLVILSIIIIVILFTIVYCMQQKDQKKRGPKKGSRKRK